MSGLTIDYKIAAGYNNAAGLVRVSSIVPSSDIAFTDPKGFNGYNAGQIAIRGNGTAYFRGFGSTKWPFGFWTVAQYTYLQTTYCGGAGNFSGLVTIRTVIGTSTYANFNAVLTLPRPDEIEYQGRFWLSPAISFTRMVAI